MFDWVLNKHPVIVFILAGFDYEVRRTDRDKYVSINKDNTHKSKFKLGL